MSNDLVEQQKSSLQLPTFATEVSIPDEWLAAKSAMVKKSGQLTSVENAMEADEVGTVMSRLSKHSSKLEKQRLAFTKPFRDAQSKIKKLCDDQREALEAEKKRLQGLLTGYANEVRRREDEERRRQEQAVRDAAEQQLAETGTVVNETLPPQQEVIPETIIGARIVKRLEYEITDKRLLPQPFLMPNEPAIRQWMHAPERKDKIIESIEAGTQPIPGLVFRVETKTQAR